MKGIKIRAWDNIEQRFWSLLDGGEASGSGSVQYFGNEQGELEIGRLEEIDTGCGIDTKFTTFSLMQWTGLKDKNGREIYEGDLVEFYDFWDEITGGHAEGKSRVGKVEYIGTGFFVTDIKDEEYESDLFLLKINDDELEVIGNIYENPELLSKEETEK